MRGKQEVTELNERGNKRFWKYIRGETISLGNGNLTNSLTLLKMKVLSILYASLLACLTRCAISAATPPQSTNTSSTASDSGNGLDNNTDLIGSNPKYND